MKDFWVVYYIHKLLRSQTAAKAVSVITGAGLALVTRKFRMMSTRIAAIRRSDIQHIARLMKDHEKWLLLNDSFLYPGKRIYSRVILNGVLLHRLLRISMIIVSLTPYWILEALLGLIYFKPFSLCYRFIRTLLLSTLVCISVELLTIVVSILHMPRVLSS